MTEYRRSEHMARAPRPLNSGEPAEYTVAFLLVPGFSFIGFASAIEPLRMADMVADRPRYGGVTVSLDGEPVSASNGVCVKPDHAIDTLPQIQAALVCGANPIRYPDAERLIAWLKRLDGEGVALGSIDTGSDLLARAGLLDGHRCTTHWQDLSIMAASYPDLVVSDHLFEIDEDRFTGGGATAAVDMMLELISRGPHGPSVAASAADLLVHDRMRQGGDHQRLPLRKQLGTAEPALRTAVAIMEGTVNSPLSIADIASHVKLSERQLARIIRKFIGCTPIRYYRDLRLNQARRELLYTDASVSEVALNSGFRSLSYFSRRYAELFGIRPCRDRQRGGLRSRGRVPGPSQ